MLKRGSSSTSVRCQNCEQDRDRGQECTLFCVSILSRLMKVEDSLIGALAAASRIAACFFFAFAPDRRWFYVGPVVNIFSHAGLPALRSIATKKVSSSEIAQLSSLMSVSEAFAPSVYMPASNSIYAATIADFPGAFYMFDASLTLLALLLFWSIYALKLRERKNTVTDPAKKEEFARSNEITYL
ncbi:hypothetical protein EVAR_81024_1 [Eumeta japonica]|uniref:Solute carrier family 46 member 3 n=1 Tax=Eumeta variegata TaxID=151549 RepID=A0A4C1T8C2_EUMVA|nr:hypothetical protein EVAR_81024_1 [Eumeta japonica]